MNLEQLRITNLTVLSYLIITIFMKHDWKQSILSQRENVWIFLRAIFLVVSNCTCAMESVGREMNCSMHGSRCLRKEQRV